MTTREAQQILILIENAWPRAGLSLETKSIYAAMLVDLDFEDTKTGVCCLLKTCKFAPSIAEIFQVASERSLPEPHAAWALVCRRYGATRGNGDRNVELGPIITAALDAAGIDSYRFHTAESQHWLKRDFLDAYTVMRTNALQSESEESRILNAQTRQNGHARLGLGMGMDEAPPA